MVFVQPCTERKKGRGRGRGYKLAGPSSKATGLFSKMISENGPWEISHRLPVHSHAFERGAVLGLLADAWLASHKLRESFKVKRARERPSHHGRTRTGLWKSCITRLSYPWLDIGGPAFYVCGRASTGPMPPRRFSLQPPDDPASLVANKLTFLPLFRPSRLDRVFSRTPPRPPPPRHRRSTRSSRASFHRYQRSDTFFLLSNGRTLFGGVALSFVLGFRTSFRLRTLRIRVWFGEICGTERG